MTFLLFMFLSRFQLLNFVMHCPSRSCIPPLLSPVRLSFQTSSTILQNSFYSVHVFSNQNDFLLFLLLGSRHTASGQWSDPMLSLCITTEVGNLHIHFVFTMTLSIRSLIRWSPYRLLNQLNCCPLYPISTILVSRNIELKASIILGEFGLPPSFSDSIAILLKSPTHIHSPTLVRAICLCLSQSVNLSFQLLLP